MTEMLGTHLSKDVNVTVHVETMTDIHTVIPVQARIRELGEDELALVCGGMHAYPFPLKHH